MGIFDQQSNLFATYQARLRFRDRIMGGTPKDPKIIEGWLRSKAGIEQEEEIRRATLRTMMELGADVRPDMTFEEMEEASKALAAVKSTNGFKRDDTGLYIESRTIKAALKESTAILFPYQVQKWGATKKAARAMLAERVFVSPDKVYLGVMDPSGVDLFIGHTSGPKGPQSNLTYYEYVQEAEVSFTVMVAEDAIPLEAWPDIWVHSQENGLGALRSQGFGRFDVLAWDKIDKNAKVLTGAR